MSPSHISIVFMLSNESISNRIKSKCDRKYQNRIKSWGPCQHPVLVLSHTHTHSHLPIHMTHMHAHTNQCTQHTHTPMHTTLPPTHRHKYTDTHTPKHTHTYIYIYIYVYTYIYVYIYIYIRYIYIYIYIIHTYLHFIICPIAWKKHFGVAITPSRVRSWHTAAVNHISAYLALHGQVFLSPIQASNLSRLQ